MRGVPGTRRWTCSDGFVAPRLQRAWFLAVLVAVVAGACTSSGDTEPPPAVSGVPTATAGTSPVDDSPFCRTLLALEDDPAPSTPDDLIATYRSLVDEVPGSIRPEFQTVLGHLESLRAGEEPAVVATPPVTVSPDLEFEDLGIADPVEESARRLAEFVDQQCRNTAVSPLPPPTQPLPEPVTTTPS